MRLFKSVDKQIKELGFKIRCNYNPAYIVQYERYDDHNRFAHIVSIVHKKNGKHILQSYEYNTSAHTAVMVGLTYEELRVFTKKMRKLGWTN